MLGAAAGLDRAHIYMLRNVNDKGGGKFETCGLTSEKAQPVICCYLLLFAVKEAPMPNQPALFAGNAVAAKAIVLLHGYNPLSSRAYPLQQTEPRR